MKPRTPSIQALQKAFPGYDAPCIRALLVSDTLVENYLLEHNILAQFYNRPDRRYARMLALNHYLEMYGVEHAGQCGERGFSYLNTGDAYGTTLIQFDDKASIFIGTWGDIVEHGRYK